MNHFIIEIILQEDVLIIIKEVTVTQNSGNITVRVHNIKIWALINMARKLTPMARKLTPKTVMETLPNVLYVSQYTIGIRNAL